ncbi:MAG: 2-polyprenyl-3-methyl-6-methoxy-1,4-benzoquinone monooxygenase [Betaproteobacteria bacterium]|nr:2-polyprenyl-3-methyl-6-methoxy-1,4-benzoquinone monooxygenase [Betaproteobacteria bacterium]
MAFTFADRLIVEIDRGVRTLFSPATAARPVPAAAKGSSPSLTDERRAESARLMRVNHTGEVCAQALYQGQAIFSRSPVIHSVLLKAAQEERDHLAWCEHRLDQLGASVSVLNPVWYAGSFTLGMLSGLAGDRWSMAFLVETERQVERHLAGHLDRIAPEDNESRAIIEAMKEDEARHGQLGQAHDAASLPRPVQSAMQLVSKLMTRTSYWV